MLPNKVLITSRHESYVGDFAVHISGMTDIEADELLLQEGRANYCEPALTPEVRDQIKSATGRSPYLMKLAVSQLGSGTLPNDLVAKILSRPNLLEALFERSYEALSEEGALAFLVLGAHKKPIPVPFLTCLPQVRQGEPVAELRRYSLGMSDESTFEASLVPVAAKYSQRLLPGHSLEFEVKNICRGLHRWLIGDGRLETAFGQLAEEATTEGSQAEREELISYAQAIAEDVPSLWHMLAKALWTHGIHKDAQAAYRRACEYDATNETVWRERAAVEESLGQSESALFLRIRAVECPNVSPVFTSQVAGDLVYHITQRKMQIEPRRRSALVESVIAALERFRREARLNAISLSRLGWLYMVQWSNDTDPDRALIRMALQCAKEGLSLDGGNEYCRGLQERAEENLRQLDQRP
ncbi:MAG: hypothetical protein Q8O40_02890 [Chloroflexota bacterium]|nr:hypothetical protein [Chloroflexota bacterium]